MNLYQQRAAYLKALAHPTRLRIADILREGEACVCHLTAILGLRQPYVSQQLMTMREAGLVCDRREGVLVYYSLADEGLRHVLSAVRAAVNPDGAEALPTVPSGPVEGCACPKCSAERGRSSAQRRQRGPSTTPDLPA